MRIPLWVLFLSICLAVFALSRARPTIAAAAVTPGDPADRHSEAQPPQSLAGRSVRIYFRGTDQIAVPFTSENIARGRVRLDYVTGVVKQLEPGWIELAEPDAPSRPDAWVPASSVAVIMTESAALKPPATQP